MEVDVACRPGTPGRGARSPDRGCGLEGSAEEAAGQKAEGGEDHPQTEGHRAGHQPAFEALALLLEEVLSGGGDDVPGVSIGHGGLSSARAKEVMRKPDQRHS